jgi:hypothetical protein
MNAGLNGVQGVAGSNPAVPIMEVWRDDALLSRMFTSVILRDRFASPRIIQARRRKTRQGRASEASVSHARLPKFISCGPPRVAAVAENR